MDHCPPPTPLPGNCPPGSDSMRRLVQPGVEPESMLALMERLALPAPYWYAPRVMLYRGDCLDIIPMLRKAFDAIISDPPYGIDFQKGAGGKGVQGPRRKDWGKIMGDDEDFDPTPMLGHAGPIVLWGANHYASKLPRGRWLAWNKLGSLEPWDSFSDVEFAWHNVRGADRIFSLLWKGAMQEEKTDNGRRYHPTMKPVRLMAWCMDEAKVESNAVVLDPYMGSGSTGLAALRTGRRFIGIEKDPTHFQTALDRIQKELAQGDLFHGLNKY